jgi:hypothetical protein
MSAALFRGFVKPVSRSEEYFLENIFEKILRKNGIEMYSSENLLRKTIREW